MKECKCKLIVLGEFVRQRVFFFAPFSPGSRKYIKRTLLKMFKPIEWNVHLFFPSSSPECSSEDWSGVSLRLCPFF